MSEQRIKVGEIERGIFVRLVQELNAAQAALDRAAQVGNDTFAVFCGSRGLPQTAQFVKVEGDEIVVRVPDEPASPA